MSNMVSLRATIRTRWEVQCLPYAGFFLSKLLQLFPLPCSYLNYKLYTTRSDHKVLVLNLPFYPEWFLVVFKTQDSKLVIHSYIFWRFGLTNGGNCFDLESPCPIFQSQETSNLMFVTQVVKFWALAFFINTMHYQTSWNS